MTLRFGREGFTPHLRMGLPGTPPLLYPARAIAVRSAKIDPGGPKDRSKGAPKDVFETSVFEVVFWMCFWYLFGGFLVHFSIHWEAFWRLWGL